MPLPLYADAAMPRAAMSLNRHAARYAAVAIDERYAAFSLR